MSEQQTLKVYELAKELGVDSISLVDKLRMLNINVKNHMSELTGTDVLSARTSLTAKPATAKAPVAKSAARATSKAGTTAKSVKSAAPAGEVATKKTALRTRKKSDSPTVPASESPQAADAQALKSTSPIIRRRVKAEGTESISETTVVRQGTAPSSSAHASDDQTSGASASSQTQANYSQANLGSMTGMSKMIPLEEESLSSLARDISEDEEDSQKTSLDSESSTSESTELSSEHLVRGETLAGHGASREASELENEQRIDRQKKVLTQDSPSEPQKTTASPKSYSPPKVNVLSGTQSPVGTVISRQVISSSAPAGISPGIGAEKKELTAGAGEGTSPEATPKSAKAPIVFAPRPQAPRKSILKIVEATAPPQRPMIKPATPSTTSARVTPAGARPGTTTTGDKDFRVTRISKEGLDLMVEEENAKKRAAGAKETILKPEDVRFADYRKKEMVFLPKRKRLPSGKELKKTKITVAKAQKRIVEMGDMITIHNLAEQLSVKSIDVVRKLMTMGQMVNVNQSIDFDTATLVANEYQYEVRNISFNEASVLKVEADEENQLVSRPPVVTIMGHVDHGKTTLLDSIREANVASGEAGGITQHIGAYTIIRNGHQITFIDTPGHEAFTVMRARGANVTDIVILVVSADDGVMPQTREAISHAKAAKVPIIVAVNKIDKPGANPEKIKQALAELDLLAEDWGGQTQFVQVSALKKTNIDQLLEAILLQAEVLDLKANPNARANGTVLEARLDRGRGPVASVLVRRGTLSVGDSIVCGIYPGRIKAMVDHLGRPVQKAPPGIAVEVLGLTGVPNAGEVFDATESETDAQTIAANRAQIAKEKAIVPAQKMSLDALFSKVQAGNAKELNVILKADVFGSLEAIKDSLIKSSTDKVKIKVLLASTGGITESDVALASASDAIIVGFNVRPETKARQIAESEQIEIKCYKIIYELLDDIKQSMIGLLDKKKVERFLGRAEVRQTFTVPKIGTIAGCSVIDGKVLRGANVRLLRDSRIIFEGKMSSLKRFKDDAKEVATGYECGIGIENYNDLKPGDLIEAYQIDLIAGEL
jgi:translation initiation factor IF-2